MGVETAIIVGGAAVNAYGQHQANRAQKKAARANAAQYAEQKRLQEIATRKELNDFERESEQFLGEQVSLFSRSGVDFSGSALLQFVSDKTQIAADKEAIRQTGESNSRVFDIRRNQALKEARDISKSQGIQTLGSILNIASSGFDAQRKFGDSGGNSPSGKTYTGS